MTGFLNGPLMGLEAQWDACTSVEDAKKLTADLEQAGFDASEELRRAGRKPSDLYRRLLAG